MGNFQGGSPTLPDWFCFQQFPQNSLWVIGLRFFFKFFVDPAQTTLEVPGSSEPVAQHDGTSTELDKYWKAVKDNPSDFTGWTYLLQFVEQDVRILFC